MNNPYLINSLRDGIEALEVLVRLLHADRLDIPTGKDRFSPRAVVAHMADWEPRLRARLEGAKAQPGVPVLVWDEGELALENRYDESDLDEQIGLLKAEREKTISFLQSLGAEDWNLPFQHPEYGRLTIEDQASFFLGHDAYHLEQLSSVLASSG